MVRAGTVFPQVMVAAYKPFWRDWRRLQENGEALDRNSRKAGWNFFFLAAGVSSIAWGGWSDRNIETAVRRALEKAKDASFNCLEVTALEARRFLGIPYVSVRAHARHLQAGAVLGNDSPSSSSQAAGTWAVE